MHTERTRHGFTLRLKVETGRFANESFWQRSFRKRLWSDRKRVEVSSQTFRSQFANVINIDMSTYVLTVQFRILTLFLNYWVWNLTLQTFTRFRILHYLLVVCVNYWMWTLTAYFPLVVGQLTRDVFETTVGETTRWRNDRHSSKLYFMIVNPFVFSSWIVK